MKKTRAEIELPPKLVPVFEGKARTRYSFGGRGSGKTRSFALMTAVKGYQWGMQGMKGQILCGREFMNSLNDSSLEEIKSAMDLDNNDCLVATTPTSAPYERLGMTAKTIMDAKRVFLHLNGSSKLHTLEKAMELKDVYKMPIYAFLDDGLDIYWSP